VTRLTASALSELLLHPATALLPSYSPLRRAGIDLVSDFKGYSMAGWRSRVQNPETKSCRFQLGRGFCVWQPYLDINKILVALLELCANADKTVPG